jgi:hypothetical protein
VYFNSPTQLNASQILPIIIEQKSQSAYFYQFKDNHIYNFKYANTFIGELVDYACILELASDDVSPENEAIAETDRDEGSTQQSMASDRGFYEIGQNVSVYNQIPSHRKRNVNSGSIRSVTN